MSSRPPPDGRPRGATNDERLAAVEPLARDLVRFLTRDPARPFYGEVRVVLTVEDGLIQSVSGRYKGTARPPSSEARAYRAAG